MSEGVVSLPPPPPPPPCPKLPPVGTENRNDSKILVRRNLVEIQDRQCSTDEDHASKVSHLISRLLRPNDSITASAENCQPAYLSFFRNVTPVVQDGPSCGLAALCMALELIHGSSFKLLEVLEVSRELGFTKQGEMFSAVNLLSLAQHLRPCTGYLVDQKSDVGTKTDIIINELLRQNVILIPYDKDCNNEPCLKSGCRAHWALLAGFLVVGESEQFGRLREDGRLIQDTSIPHLFHLQKSSINVEDFDGARTADLKFYVYAFHGQSLQCRLWSLSDLLQSNTQLVSLSPEIESNIDAYVIPQSGVKSGLCDQFVVLAKAS